MAARQVGRERHGAVVAVVAIARVAPLLQHVHGLAGRERDLDAHGRDWAQHRCTDGTRQRIEPFARACTDLDGTRTRSAQSLQAFARIRDAAVHLGVLGPTRARPRGRLVVAVEPFLRGGGARPGQPCALAIAERIPLRTLVRHTIELVQHDDPGLVAGADLVEHLLDRAELALGVRIARIEEDQQHMCSNRILERAAKARHEVVRQPPDETDGVAEQAGLAATELPGFHARVQCGEELVVGEGAPGGERIEEAALARIRVPHDTHREVVGATARNLACAAQLHLGELTLQLREPALDEPAVDLDLLLAGTARAHAHGRATGDLAQVGPHRTQSRCRVFELRDLDLELRGARGRTAREDVEHELAPVEHLALHGLLERLELTRGKVVVEQDHLGAQLLHHCSEGLDLALAQVTVRVGL